MGFTEPSGSPRMLVRSYRTVSPLPVQRTDLCRPARRHRRSALCCTFLRVTPTGRYPASCPVESGRSSDGSPLRRAGPYAATRPTRHHAHSITRMDTRGRRAIGGDVAIACVSTDSRGQFVRGFGMWSRWSGGVIAAMVAIALGAGLAVKVAGATHSSSSSVKPQPTGPPVVAGRTLRAELAGAVTFDPKPGAVDVALDGRVVVTTNAG